VAAIIAQDPPDVACAVVEVLDVGVVVGVASEVLVVLDPDVALDDVAAVEEVEEVAEVVETLVVALVAAVAATVAAVALV
jgi:hypothetical protein